MQIIKKNNVPRKLVYTGIVFTPILWFLPIIIFFIANKGLKLTNDFSDGEHKFLAITSAFQILFISAYMVGYFFDHMPMQLFLLAFILHSFYVSGVVLWRIFVSKKLVFSTATRIR